MKRQTLISNLLLLLAAAIWGLAFVAQRVGSQYLGSFSFNGLRFALGGASLIPLILVKKRGTEDLTFINPWPAGLLAGTVLFIAASLQQLGLEETTAGKAAFITGLYIVLVPIFGLFLKQRVAGVTWGGILVTAVGLYFLSVKENLSMARGDVLELIGSFFWAAHILVIDYFSKKVAVLKLSAIQFLTCAILSLAVACQMETITIKAVEAALTPLLYGGVFSVGIAYTLQVIGQRYAKPSHAAIILSMEAVFASLGGMLILGESMGPRGLIGCGLMLTGMLLAQVVTVGHRVVKKQTEASVPMKDLRG